MKIRIQERQEAIVRMHIGGTDREQMNEFCCLAEFDDESRPMSNVTET